MITVKLAGLSIGIDNRFDYIEKYARDYLTDEPPIFTVAVSDTELEREAAMSDDEHTPGYLESIAAYRKIAERMPEFDAVVFHGAVLSHGGNAYAFTARSGVGKTTHTKLWISTLKDVHYLNGDKPIIRLIDGVPYAFGTPWRGKEGYGVNESAPLRAIALLNRGEKNTAEVIEAKDGAMRLMSQIYISRNPMTVALTMRVADRIARAVRFVELRCNMEPEAAIVASEAMIQ
jgi:hypothetical protein